jgi:VIT1/CCC1 family predicted Fe2+/Mn2+ transporter
MLIGTTSAVRYAFLTDPPDRIETLRTALFLAIAWGAIGAGLGLVVSAFGQGRERLAARQAGDVPRPIRLTRDDWMTALAVLCATLAASLPVVVPFFFPAPLGILVWISNALAIAALGWVGWFWARWTDFPRWVGALALVLIGLVAVAVTVLLGVA